MQTSHTLGNLRERAIEAFWILNDFIRDLIGGTKAIDHFDTPKFKAGATEQVLQFYNNMAESFLFITLAKWIEFYDKYKQIIPSGQRDVCKQLRNELERRGIKDFRNKVVGHIWSDDHSRPLLPSEIEELGQKITKGHRSNFLKWINDPANNSLGTTIVGTSEAVRNEIQKYWSLSEKELV
jgi:hypothetical protein